MGILNLQEGDVINSFPKLFYHRTFFQGKSVGTSAPGHTLESNGLRKMLVRLIYLSVINILVWISVDWIRPAVHSPNRTQLAWFSGSCLISLQSRTSSFVRARSRWGAHYRGFATGGWREENQERNVQTITLSDGDGWCRALGPCLMYCTKYKRLKTHLWYLSWEAYTQIF